MLCFSSGYEVGLFPYSCVASGSVFGCYGVAVLGPIAPYQGQAGGVYG